MADPISTKDSDSSLSKKNLNVIINNRLKNQLNVIIKSRLKFTLCQ